MARLVVCILCVFSICAGLGVWRAERKLAAVQRENTSLSIQLELVRNEYFLAQCEIEHQNEEISKYAAAMEQASIDYQMSLEKLASEKALAEQAIIEELSKDSSAENQLKLIAEVLQDFISPVKGGGGE